MSASDRLRFGLRSITERLARRESASQRSVVRGGALTLLCVALAACSPPPSPLDGGDGSSTTETSVDVSTPTDTGTTADSGTSMDATVASDAADAGAIPDAATPSDSAVDGAVDGASTQDAGDGSVAADGGDGGAVATAWWQQCNASSACAGENGTCYRSFGTARCLHTCNAQADWSSCEGGQGICVPSDGEKLCLKRCGDTDNQLCGAGAACLFLGYRDATATEAGVPAVGVCVPECQTSGADACNTPGRTCVASTRTCNDNACGGPCPTGSACAAGECVPSPVAGLYGTCRTTSGAMTNGCRSELCLGNATTGFCTSYCTSEDDAVCGAQGLCWLGAESISPPAMGMLPDSLIAAYPTQFTAVGGRSKGICLKQCSDSGDCPARWHCGTHSGRRVCMPTVVADPTVMAGAGLPGTACTANADCASALCAAPTGSRFGICARAAAATCPAGTVEASSGSQICLRTCTLTANSCGPGLVCSSDMRCRIGACRQNTDCAAGYACNVASGTCQTAPFASGGAVGDACTTPTSCASGTCLTATGGYCSLGCTLLDDFSDTCPAGSICNTNIRGSSAICLDLCDNGVGVSRFGMCRTGFTCDPFASDRRFGACVPR